MLQLTKDDIYLNQQADNKQDAIKKIASALTQRQFVEEGYVNGMLERELQAATFLGSGIAIPHGTTTTRHLVKKTGVQVFCFPHGVEWGDDGEKAYIAIGIAASSDEHLTLLRQLTHVLGDDDVEDRIREIQTVDDAICLLTGKSNNSDESIITSDLILLDIPADGLDTLQALNASRLKRIGAIDTSFVTHVLDQKPSYLGQGVWLSDCNSGNLKNALAISRTASQIEDNNDAVNILLTVAVKTDEIDVIIQRLAEMAYHQQLNQLHTADKETIYGLLTGAQAPSLTHNDAVIDNAEALPDLDETPPSLMTKEFIVVNPHGLHTRPASVLVKVVKEFNSKITVANLDGTANAVSATSLMKVVAIGAKKGSRLQFVAEGEDASQALDAIGQAINDGLGEGQE